MCDYEEIVNASDKKILMALETAKFPWEREIRAENLERWIGHYTGVSEARAIAYKTMWKKY